MRKKIFLSISLLLVGILLGVVVKILVFKERTLIPTFAPLHNVEDLVVSEASPSGILSGAHNSFGIDLIQKIYKEDTKGNIFISPLSIALDLSMVYNGADGVTRDAMARTLKYDNLSLDQINKGSLELSTSLEQADKKVQIAIANSIWAKEGEQFNNDFLRLNQNYFKAKVESVNFESVRTVESINKWVSDNTNSKITKIIDPPIPSEAVMYLINAVYFKGIWTTEFDKKLTENRNFLTSSSGTKKVPMMVRSDKLQYLENDLFQSAALPYGENKKIRMIVILPRKNIDNFLGQLTIKNWNKWMTQYKETEGKLLIPKFKIEYEKKLNNVLSALGMGVAFSNGANFNRMKVDPSGPELFISDVLHKTYVDVNEEGTEAAAVTSTGIVAGSIMTNQPKPFYMEVNKPFFFVINDSQTSEILFSGIIQDPSK